jgi:NitT/TauT family transport system permease protein
MSKVESIVTASPSPQYRAWLQRERRAHRAVRLTQLAILVVFLVLWEVLPKALIVNPVLTSYPSALWPTFLDLLKSTPQQASILAHTWATVLATVLGFTGAMVIGTAVAAALWWWNALYKVLDPYLVIANAMPKTAFVPIFYIWLGATMSIYGMSLAISVFITILMIYSGFQGIDPNKVKRRTDCARHRWRRATRSSSTAISTRCGRSSRSMSKVESIASAGPSPSTSPQYRA